MAVSRRTRWGVNMFRNVAPTRKAGMCGTAIAYSLTNHASAVRWRVHPRIFLIIRSFNVTVFRVRHLPLHLSSGTP